MGLEIKFLNGGDEKGPAILPSLISDWIFCIAASSLFLMDKRFALDLADLMPW